MKTNKALLQATFNGLLEQVDYLENQNKEIEKIELEITDYGLVGGRVKVKGE